jgi:hypothetical protein
VFSEWARQSIRERAARARGVGQQVLEAVKEIDRLLRLYPQFGDPLADLAHEVGQSWVGTIRPLVVRYAVYEERRQVIVAVPLLPLPGSGL